MELHFDGVSVSLDGKRIVSDLSLTVGEGQIVGLVGPNGSGKSTALRCVYRALKPTAGAIWVGQQMLNDLSLRDSARLIGALAQDAATDLDFTVRELVELGRTPHLTGNARLSGAEVQLCHRAMDEMDVLHLADRGVLSLSGGERQRVLLARALAQTPRILILDEPTNHLDLRHQITLLSHLRTTGLTVLIVLHDLNLAAATCDQLAVLHQGSLVASGSPTEVLTPQLVRDVFGVDIEVVKHPGTGEPQLLYSLTSSPGKEFQ